MADVFLSYKRDERAAVETIAARLRMLGLEVWFDASMRSGDAFDGEIDREARQAKVVLVCWSPSARESEWVKSEAMIGFNQRKLAACHVAGPSNFDPPAPFNRTHVADLRNWLASPTDEDPEWKSVLRRIGELCGRADIASFGALDKNATASNLRDWVKAHRDSPLFLSVDAALTAREAQDSERERLTDAARVRRDEVERVREERSRARRKDTVRAAVGAGAQAEHSESQTPARRSFLPWGIGLLAAIFGIFVIYANSSPHRVSPQGQAQDGITNAVNARGSIPMSRGTSSGCTTRSTAPWVNLTIVAETAGATCSQSTATISIQSQNGERLWLQAYETRDVMTLAYANDAAAMRSSVREWIAPNGSMATSSALPAWPANADGPQSGEFPFYADEGVTRALYGEVRTANVPMYCYVQGMETLRCVVFYRNMVMSIGAQTFPG